MRTASVVTGATLETALRHLAVTVAARCDIWLSQCISSSRAFSGHGSL